MHMNRTLTFHGAFKVKSLFIDNVKDVCKFIEITKRFELYVGALYYYILFTASNFTF